ncbi:hypothetical protein RND81_05G134700 [Saponaria officinalis]|uniref:MADS-box domain-containing protein n=1 Tax=Saponaria officinalis TaxID=3572 RepID=A0AAW1KST3_SAPOF
MKNYLKNFKHRKTTIFKNAKELSILCGVDLALIMYEVGNPNPEVWCSRPDSIEAIANSACGNLPPKRPRVVDDCEFVKSLGVEELHNLAGVLGGKIEKVNERINLLRGNNNDSCDDDNLIDMIDFSDEGLKFDEIDWKSWLV